MHMFGYLQYRLFGKKINEGKYVKESKQVSNNKLDEEESRAVVLHWLWNSGVKPKSSRSPERILWTSIRHSNWIYQSQLTGHDFHALFQIRVLGIAAHLTVACVGE